MKFICDQHKTCRHRRDCGGAVPHDHCEGECNKCPMNKEAKCIESLTLSEAAKQCEHLWMNMPLSQNIKHEGQGKYGK